jgi:hypothetical protein
MSNEQILKFIPSSAMSFIDKAIDFCNSKEEAKIFASGWDKFSNSFVISSLPVNPGNNGPLGMICSAVHQKQFEKYDTLRNQPSTDPNSLKFYKKLFILFDKFYEFTEKGQIYQSTDAAQAKVYLKAAKAVLGVCHQVADTYSEYKKNKISREEFTNKMDNILKAGKEVELLHQHRGMKQILVDILTAFSKLIPSLSFFAPKTDSFQKMLDVADSAKQLNSKPKT